jgi:hypothetical protein
VEPCRSVSNVGHSSSISLYPDIKGATFDIEVLTMTFDIGYDMTIIEGLDLRFRMNSERCRYRRLKPSIPSISTQYDIEETSISTCPDIEDLSISKNETSISAKDIEDLIFHIDVRVLQYRCFFVGSRLGCCSSYSVLDTDCCVHITLRINHRPWLMRRPGRPQQPQQGLHLAVRPHRPHQPQHRPQPLVHRRRSIQQSTSAGPRTPSGAALGPAKYFNLNLVPESP